MDVFTPALLLYVSGLCLWGLFGQMEKCALIKNEIQMTGWKFWPGNLRDRGGD
jgi:hypothetical protein